MYADYEENFGLINNAMHVYEQACEKLDKDDKYEVCNLYIAKTTEYFGVGRTREAFTKAFEIF